MAQPRLGAGFPLAPGRVVGLALARPDFLLPFDQGFNSAAEWGQLLRGDYLAQKDKTVLE